MASFPECGPFYAETIYQERKLKQYMQNGCVTWLTTKSFADAEYPLYVEFDSSMELQSSQIHFGICMDGISVMSCLLQSTTTPNRFEIPLTKHFHVMETASGLVQHWVPRFENVHLVYTCNIESQSNPLHMDVTFFYKASISRIKPKEDLYYIVNDVYYVKQLNYESPQSKQTRLFLCDL